MISSALLKRAFDVWTKHCKRNKFPPLKKNCKTNRDNGNIKSTPVRLAKRKTFSDATEKHGNDFIHEHNKLKLSAFAFYIHRSYRENCISPRLLIVI